MAIKTVWTDFSVDVSTIGYVELGNPAASGKRIQVLGVEITTEIQTNALSFVGFGRQPIDASASLLAATGIMGYSESLVQTDTAADIRKGNLGSGVLASARQGYNFPLRLGETVKRTFDFPIDLPEGDCVAFHIASGTNLDFYSVSFTIREEDA